MTYVSRRTRIIVSSWLDECDAEYRLRATRKRSDGRLKKYSSCEDFRAWVNDNCIKHEYLTELMSNGGFPDRSPFRLYGRFIPVPVLFQLAHGSNATEANQITKEQDGKQDVQGQEGNQYNFNKQGFRNVNQDPNALGVNQDMNPRDVLDGNANPNARRSKSETAGKQGDSNKNSDEDFCFEEGETKLSRGSVQSSTKVYSNSGLIRAQWEKSLLEKSLLQTTCLLNKAMKKLEKIDSIVALVQQEHENARTEEIQDAFYKSKLSCSCSAISTSYSPLLSSKSCLKKLKESAKCTELLRKISGLREKLKKIQECRREVNHQIQSSKRRFECASALQVTELYSRREQANIKKLQKKLEKLIAERGRLLSEMCQALTNLNNIKRSSRSSMNFRKGDSKAIGNEFGCERLGESAVCNCGCKCSDNSPESEDSNKSPCSGSSSSDSDSNSFVKSRHAEGSFPYDFQSDESNKYENTDFDRDYASHYDYEKPGMENRNRYSNFDPGNRKQDQQLASPRETNAKKRNAEETEKENSKANGAKVNGTRAERTKVSGTKADGTKINGTKAEGKKVNGTKEEGKKVNGTKGEGTKTEDSKETKGTKKSKVQFICPESPCRKKLDANDLSDFENTLTQEQLCIISEALQNFQQSRPNTSPTTKRERQSASEALDRDGQTRSAMDSAYQGSAYQGSGTEARNGTGTGIDTRTRTWTGVGPGTALDRRVKSETTMKDIEKTLRNYQRRLSEMENLENSVEEMKEKISEGHLLRKNLAKMKAEKKQRDAEREKSEREMSRLCSENWELKKQVQDLTAKFSAQTKKIQNLKCGAMRARELECQAEELKKELSEYREGFEHQRKCISKWESVVAVQRTEIENLMNHIRMLTTTKEDEASDGGFREKGCVQRSRSFSPEPKARTPSVRPRTQSRTFAPASDEDVGCYCETFLQPESRRMSQPRNFDRSYYPLQSQWCN